MELKVLFFTLGLVLFNIIVSVVIYLAQFHYQFELVQSSYNDRCLLANCEYKNFEVTTSIDLLDVTVSGRFRTGDKLLRLLADLVSSSIEPLPIEVNSADEDDILAFLVSMVDHRNDFYYPFDVNANCPQIAFNVLFQTGTCPTSGFYECVLMKLNPDIANCRVDIPEELFNLEIQWLYTNQTGLNDMGFIKQDTNAESFSLQYRASDRQLSDDGKKDKFFYLFQLFQAIAGQIAFDSTYFCVVEYDLINGFGIATAITSFIDLLLVGMYYSVVFILSIFKFRSAEKQNSVQAEKDLLQSKSEAGTSELRRIEESGFGCHCCGIQKLTASIAFILLLLAGVLIAFCVIVGIATATPSYETDVCMNRNGLGNLDALPDSYKICNFVDEQKILADGFSCT